MQDGLIKVMYDVWDISVKGMLGIHIEMCIKVGKEMNLIKYTFYYYSV